MFTTCVGILICAVPTFIQTLKRLVIVQTTAAVEVGQTAKTQTSAIVKIIRAMVPTVKKGGVLSPSSLLIS